MQGRNPDAAHRPRPDSADRLAPLRSLTEWPERDARWWAEAQGPILNGGALQEALKVGGIGLWSWDLSTNIIDADAACREAWGLPAKGSVHLSSFLDCIHPDDSEAVREAALATRAGREDYAVEFRVQHADGSERWLRVRGRRNESRRGLRIVGVTIDVTLQKQVETLHDLLGRELNHRIKNLFSVTAGLVTLSARGGSDETRAFASTVRGRIEALGRAHDTIRPDTAAPLGEAEPTGSFRVLLSTILTPYGFDHEDGARIAISGYDCPIGPRAATSLALIFHEFATNAAKYGALSVEHGAVAVDVACRTEGGVATVVWTERGGPAVDGAPAREGFGSVLARRSVTGDLGGTLAFDWRRSGLVATITAPLKRLAT